MKNLFPAIIAVFCLAASAGCYHDKESDLYPKGVCDTATVKWSTTIQPILQTNCAYAGCHSNADLAGGINLTTYDGVKAVVDDGSLVGSIIHDPAYTPMPRGTEKLPDCTISKIRIWVAAGALNN